MTTPTSPFGGASVPSEYQSAIITSASRWGISPALLAAQIQQESGWNPHAVSSAGAEGIAQFMPGTASSLGLDPWNALASIDAAAKLDASYIKKFGTPELALAAYNAGPGAVEKYGGIPPFAETQFYVKKIMAMAGAAASAVSTTPVGLSVTDFLGNTNKALSALSSGKLWRRVGTGALGAVVVLFGVWALQEKEGWKVASTLGKSL